MIDLPLTDPRLTPDLAARFAGLALDHVGREFPNKLDHELHGPRAMRANRTAIS